jgi:hypothetical protein
MPKNTIAELRTAKNWRDFTNYMEVLNFQARRPEVAQSRITAYDAQHRGRVHTPSPRHTNRRARRANSVDETGRRVRGQRGTFAKDLGTWAAEKKAERAALWQYSKWANCLVAKRRNVKVDVRDLLKGTYNDTTPNT